MDVALSPEALERGALRVEIAADPVRITVLRAGRPVVADLRLWVADGSAADRFLPLTEGVMPHEDLGPRRELRDPGAVDVTLHGEHHVEIAYAAPEGALRVGADWTGTAGRAPRRARRPPRPRPRPGRPHGAPRRRPPLHRAGLPRGDARAGRDPAGRLRARALAAVERRVRRLAADRRPRRARRPRARADRPLGARRGGTAAPAPAVRSDPRGAPAPLLRADRLPRAAAGMGLRPLEEPRRLRAPGRRARGLPRLPLAPDPARRRRDRLALGDAVQHLGVQPPPVPGPGRDGGADARGRGADGGVDHAVGEPRVDRRPAPARRRVRAPPPRGRRRTTPRARPPATSCATPTATRSWRAGGWARARRSTSPRRRPTTGGARRPARVLELGVEGIKADDGEGYYFPDDVRFADGRRGADAAWAYGGLYRRSMQRALDEVHPGRGVVFGRSGWSGQQATGMLWGGDQASDFWSLRALVAATLSAAASGFSNWSHDVGGYLGERADRALPARAAAALGAVRLLHAADAGARPLRPGAVDLRPRDARLLPRLRAAARAAGALRPRRRRDGRALRAADRAPAAAGRPRRRPRLDASPTPTGTAPRCGSRRCSRRARASARCRCRAGRGSTPPAASACAAAAACAPRRRRTRCPCTSATGRSSSPTRRTRSRPDSATARSASARSRRRCGDARASGRTGVRLADGTRIRWRAGEWSVSRRREVRFAER